MKYCSVAAATTTTTTTTPPTYNRYGDVEMVKLLLDAGADITITSPKGGGKTCIEVAEDKGHDGVVTLLGGRK